MLLGGGEIPDFPVSLLDTLPWGRKEHFFTSEWWEGPGSSHGPMDTIGGDPLLPCGDESLSVLLSFSDTTQVSLLGYMARVEV